MLLCNNGVIKSITWIKKNCVKQIADYSGATIKQYSTTFLLVGSMASVLILEQLEEIYHANSNYDAIKQSMMAEFALAYDDIPTALHNYTVWQLKAIQPPLNSAH